MLRDYLLCGDEQLASAAQLKMKTEGLRIPALEHEASTVRWAENRDIAR